MIFKKIAIGMSGGVDSAVAAYLLKKRGYDVLGVYMKNWDVTDEQGTCSADRECADARHACDVLRIPLVEVNFVKEYWNDVFLNFVDDYTHGVTPNPDILCNRHVKFDAFYTHAIERLGCDAIATGHYANTSFGAYLERYEDGAHVRLLKAADSGKDQTFFLSQIAQTALRRTLFPVGALLKRDVKRLATDVGLRRFAVKKESMGICFIGSRNFRAFIGEYVCDRPGAFVDIDDGRVVGEHAGVHQWTIGQRCLLGGYARAYYVAKKCAASNTIYVAAGTNHPALYSTHMFCGAPHWIRPCAFTAADYMECAFKFQHVDEETACRLMCSNDGLVVQLASKQRALAPGQYAVFYKQNECLGSSRIISSGVSNFTLGLLQNLRLHGNHTTDVSGQVRTAVG